MWIVSKNRSQPLGDSQQSYNCKKLSSTNNIYGLFIFFLTLNSLWDPSSPTRYWTRILGNKGMNWTTRDFLQWSVKWSESHSVMSYPLQSHGLYSAWNSPSQNTGMGSLSLLQGIFPTQGSNPGLLCCWQILYYLSHSLGREIFFRASRNKCNLVSTLISALWNPDQRKYLRLLILLTYGMVSKSMALF